MAEESQLLVAYARRGDLTALSALVEGQSPAIRAFLRGMLPAEEDAEDALQETWLRVIRFCTAYRGGSVRGYLMRIARSVMVDRYRRAGLPTVSMDASGEEDEESMTESVPDERPIPNERFEAKANAEDMRRAVRGLPAKQREILLLRIEGGLTYREIGEQLGIPLGTVLTRMRAATGRLREILGGKT